MPKITFISPDDKSMTIEIPVGWSLMEGAVKANVPGIDADCGGACACATCHVYVDPAWTAALPRKSDMEDTMLDFAPVTTSNSRLSCQIKVTAEMDGLILRVPFSQH